jgi:HEAT repeat protein
MSWLLPPLTPTFEAALRDVRAHGPEARAAAAERLGQPEPKQAQAALRGLLTLAEDASVGVRAAAVRSLKELGDGQALECLLARLDDPDALVRELAVVAIGEVGGDRAQAALRRALRSPHAEVRFQAVASYVEHCDASDPAPAALLRDPDPKVRANTARSLARLGDGAHPALREALGDSDQLVRCEAALALARCAGEADAAALRAALAHPELALEALDAIGALDLQPLREDVAAIAESLLRPRALKVAAARALLRLRDSRGVASLRSALRAFRNEGRSHAVQVVGELRVQELAPELERLARRLRGAAPETLLDALVALLPHSDPARRGLQRLAQRDDSVGVQARAALRGPPPVP